METNAPILDLCQKEVLRLRQEGQSFGQIEEQLAHQGYASENLQEAIRFVKNIHYSKRRRRGLVALGLGATLCGLGFVITFIQYQYEAPTNWALYGFTGVGATLVLYGLTEVLGF